MVAEVRSWIGTPYVLGARVKGAGVDCATLLAETLIACGLADREDLGVYSHDWFCHAGQTERYALRILRHAAKTMECVAYRSTAIEPGNLVLTRVNSRIYNHAGIVVAWPRIVHAVSPCVEEADASRHPMWINHQIAVFDPFSRNDISQSIEHDRL